MRHRALAVAAFTSLLGSFPLAVAAASPPSTPVDLLFDTARTYALRARWEDAERLLERASALSAGAQEARLQTAVQIELGRVLSSRATYQDQPFERALSVSEEALGRARALQDPELLGDALQAWAVCRYDYQFRVAAPDYAPVRQALRDALALREQHKDPHRLAETLFYLGLVHERLEQAPQAEATYERALAIALPARDTLMQAYLYRHLADLRKPAHGLAGVLDYHQRCLRLREEIGLATGIMFASVAVGETLLEMKQPEQALPHYERALAVATQINVARGAAYAQDPDLMGQILETVTRVLGPAASSPPI